MRIEADLEQRLGAFRLNVRLSSEGGLTALFGRSGSGKTSIVNLIAGLSRPDRGRVAVGGRVLLDTAAGIDVPAHRRRIGYVFQEGRLFPHLDVRRNLLYGHRFTAPSERLQGLDEVVELLGIPHLLDRPPARLSGGEKQRVAIGRALMASPRLLLMDEPLAALDGARKAEILPFIERLRDEKKIPIVYVSHAVEEVARLASTLVVLDEGRVVAMGPADEVLRRMDLFPALSDHEPGVLVDTIVAGSDEAYGLTSLATPAGLLKVPRIDRPPGASVRIRVRARDVMLATARPGGLSAQNIVAGTILRLTPSGASAVDVDLDCAGMALSARLTRQSADLLALRPGLAVFAILKTVSFERSGIDPAAAGASL